MTGDLRARLLFGPLLALFAVGACIADLVTGLRWGVLALGVTTVFLGGLEYIRLVRPGATGIQRAPVLIMALALMATAFPDLRQWLLANLEVVGAPALILGVSFTWICLIQIGVHGIDQFFANVGASLLGVVYLGLSTHLLLAMGCLAPVANPDLGPQLLLLTLATCKLGDVAAYFGGRRFGRHKLAPRISPGKTWEGFFCAVIGSVAGVFAVNPLLGLAGLPPLTVWWHPLVWGLVLGPAGVAGDLVESAMKRAAAVKDSGNVLPGFGGFLDVFDAVLFAAPVAWVLYLLLLH